MVPVEKVPPDGGYGWIIVVAFALSNLIIVPLIQNFGLIFKDTFAEMGLSATEGSLIINLNAAFGMLMGLVNGILLKVFGYRKIAMLASFLVFIGVVLTSRANSFLYFIITYGLITSLGFGLNMSAYTLAVNTYFREKRGKAVGYGMTITGLGPVIMPQVINLLMKNYNMAGVTLILGAISAHGFVAATLLQPVKRHLKKTFVPQPENNENKTENEEAESKNTTEITIFRQGSQVETRRQQSRDSNASYDDLENAPVFGLDSAFSGSMMSINSAIRNRKDSVVSQQRRKPSTISMPRIRDSVYNPEMTKPKKKKSVFARLVAFFDLDLLKDPIYLNIMLGLSLAVFAEINFSLLTPFILAEFTLNTNQIATFLSVQGISDIIFRFLAPFIADLLKTSARQTYMITLFLLMVTRFTLLLSNNFYVLLFVALGLGIAKGIRTVYMGLVIPMYVPIEKLPSASGLQMMVNGFCILVGGPVIGYIRDFTGSYTWCIVVLNCVTFTTVVLWSVEAVIQKFKHKEEVPEKTAEQRDSLLKT